MDLGLLLGRPWGMARGDHLITFSDADALVKSITGEETSLTQYLHYKKQGSVKNQKKKKHKNLKIHSYFQWNRGYIQYSFQVVGILIEAVAILSLVRTHSRLLKTFLRLGKFNHFAWIAVLHKYNFIIYSPLVQHMVSNDRS